MSSPPTAHLDVLHGRPATFTDRGVCVPFTTPTLAQSRVRTDYAGRLECLLPGFSGGKGTFVFGWRTIPEIVRITLHDRAMHREILERKDSSPDGVRLAALTVASRGFAGLAAQERAQRSLAEDHEAVIVTNFLFMLDLLRAAGFDPGSLIHVKPGDEQALILARRALDGVAEKLRVPADTLYSRVEAISRSLAPLGLPKAPRPARLRALVARLDWFQDEMDRWSKGEAPEAAQLARFMTDNAVQTLGLARDRIAALDPQLAKVQEIAVDANKAKVVTGLVGRLAWLLDGWEYICQLWEDSHDGPEDMQRLAVCEAARIVPAIPLEELVVNDNIDNDQLRTLQRRWVRPNQDWRNGGLDYDMVRRIEAVKAGMA